MPRDVDGRSSQTQGSLHDLEWRPMAQPAKVVMNSMLYDENLGAQVQMIGLDPV